MPEARLLVVDDEPNIRELLATSLRFAGFEVHAAADGHSALKLAKDVEPDLVVLDVMLPDLDGFAVLTRDPPSGQTGRGITNVISDLSERVREIFEKELDRAGLDSVVSPIYAHALIGMVVQVGHWWVETPSMSVDQVARYVAAIGWMGLRHFPKNPQVLK